ncbi:general secretion pathway protein B [Malonomonas rubra DSM 5091]|uniref:General secretion pathway protein B n=1 Tax=Malonomonas rubra DSM 5091 TaxID=1122189 RepID=A0A1M6B8Q1_MALRU|nr:hypothetical protein [Malonomonas rubra]SHI45085.1 general secretion pathway protein B [Malonomonas rubra DSM 5091]
MSSILKALRKVEDDKASLGEGSVDLAHDILKGNYEQPKPAFAMLPIVLVSVFLLFAAVLLFGVLSRLQPVADPVVVIPNVPRQDEVVSPPLEPSMEQPRQAEITQQPVDKQVSGSSSVEGSKSGEIEKNNQLRASIIIPELLVEEIVYHTDSSSRLAVISQLPVMEGTSIEGALVEKIYPDRVQFSYQGVRFNKFSRSDR